MKFMVNIQFRPEDRAAIMSLIPQEQAHLRALHEQGVEEAIYISADASRVWLVMHSESREQLQTYLESFPLYRYMQLEVSLLSGV